MTHNSMTLVEEGRRKTVDESAPKELDDVKHPEHEIYDCLSARERLALARKISSSVKVHGLTYDGMIYINGDRVSIFDAMLQTVGAWYSDVGNHQAKSFCTQLLKARSGMLGEWELTHAFIDAHAPDVKQDMTWVRYTMTRDLHDRTKAKLIVKRLLGVDIPDAERVTFREARAYKATKHVDLR